MDEELKNKASMVEIFMNLLSFFLLGVVATALGILYFQIINKYFVDPLATVVYSMGQFRSSAIHYSIAALIVGFPLYLWLEIFWFKRFSNNPEKTESRLSKWLTYIILFIASGTIIGDLITTIFNFLQGELSPRFFLKALTILVIAGFVFGFYFLERKKIQYKKDVSSVYFPALASVATLIVITGIVFGFFAAGTPYQARLQRFDLETADNLSQIGIAVNTFASSQNRLPNNLSELKNNPTYAGYFYNIADEKMKEYEYRAVDKTQYELCGTFNLVSTDSYSVPIEYGGTVNWTIHDAGRVCKTLTATLSNIQLFKPAPTP